MHVALALGGDSPSPADLKMLQSVDAIVCADSGADAVLAAGYTPDLVVGDLDSVTADVSALATRRFKREKDDIDGELALDEAISLGATRLTIVGGHGGRSAMFLANLKILRTAHDAGMDAAMVGHGEEIRFAVAGQSLPISGGATLNVLPVGGAAEVTLRGTAWDQRTTLQPTECRGVSNRAAADGASVQVHAGAVLVIVELADA